MTSETAIRITGLAKTYAIYDKPSDRLKELVLRCPFHRNFEALKPMSLELRRGEVMGIIGRNGSGKSTLLQMICGTVTPTAGSVEVAGRISALLELGSGFNPEFTGRENVYLNGAILGLSKEEVDRKYDAILAFADIGEHIARPVKTYSSGMVVRLAFAVAIAVEPEILVVDEALAVGDAIFQRKCFARINELKERGTTILFVSHAINTVVEICDRAILLDSGEHLMTGEPKEITTYYHRLIFSPEGMKDKVREEIRGHGARSPGERKVIAADAQANSFLPELVPESTIHHENKGVHLSDLHITDKKKHTVNVLQRRGSYTFHYTATFEEPQKGVRFNFMIRNLTGLQLAAGNTLQLDDTLKEVPAGTKFHVTFEFACNLLPGDYFVMVGVSGEMENGARGPLARITDAAMFRVPPEGKLPLHGLTDLMIEGGFKELK